MQKQLLYIIFLLLPVTLCCQQFRRFTFTHFNTSSGLISNQVHSVVQDEKGYMWIGTTDGLQRYDGVRYKAFRHRDGDTLSLPLNDVRQIVIDNNKNLCLLLANGKAGIFNTRTFTFREAVIKPRKESSMRSFIKRLIKDEYGHVFLLLDGREVITWNEKKHEFSFEHNFVQKDSLWSVADFVQQRGTRKYWISMSDGGVAVYDDATGELVSSKDDPGRIPVLGLLAAKSYIYNLFFDRKGRLWFNAWDGSQSYIYCYDLKTGRMVLNRYDFKPFAKSHFEATGFFEQNDSTIWVKGVKIFARYLEKESRFEHIYNGYENEKDIAYRVITGLYQDRENNIWVGTGNNGLFRFAPHREYFTNVAHTSRVTGLAGDGTPLAYAREKDGSILVGYWNDGLYRYDKNFTSIPLSIKGIPEKNILSIWDMQPSRDSQVVWMAAQSGFYRYDRASRSATYHNPAILEGGLIRNITEDTKGNLWLGMHFMGLFKCNLQQGKTGWEKGLSRFTAVPAGGRINKLLVDRQGYLWVCTSHEGVFVIDPGTDKVILRFHYNAAGANRLPEEGVTSLLEYDDSLMVITTLTHVLLYNRLAKKLSVIATPDNLSGTIASIEKDQAGHLWVSTSSSLYRINFRKKIFVSFDRNDGMTNDYFILSSSYTLPDGRMMFGTSAQFIVFDPSAILFNSNESSPVVITGFRLMNKSLLVDSLLHLKQVVLGPGENSLEIEFSCLEYITNYAIKYKLEGLNNDWKIADKDKRAVYSYLPPGTYTLLLTTIDAEGNTGKNITRLAIKVKPPFWKTWWFFCLLTLLIAGVFYWLDNQRVGRLMALQKMRTEIADNLHEEVNTTLNNISLLSEMARIKADKDALRSKEYIDQISVKSHNMINAMDDILWSIDPENDSMEKSLLRMMEYADTLENLHGVHIEIALDHKVRSLKLDMKTRHEVLLTFKQALKMLVEYAGGKSTIVHIDLFKCKLSVRLQDMHASLEKNKAEIDAAIRDISMRATQTGADLDVQHNAPGVTVLLLLPVR